VSCNGSFSVQCPGYIDAWANYSCPSRTLYPICIEASVAADVSITAGSGTGTFQKSSGCKADWYSTDQTHCACEMEWTSPSLNEITIFDRKEKDDVVILEIGSESYLDTKAFEYSVFLRREVEYDSRMLTVYSQLAVFISLILGFCVLVDGSRYAVRYLIDQNHKNKKEKEIMANVHYTYPDQTSSKDLEELKKLDNIIDESSSAPDGRINNNSSSPQSAAHHSHIISSIRSKPHSNSRTMTVSESTKELLADIRLYKVNDNSCGGLSSVTSGSASVDGFFGAVLPPWLGRGHWAMKWMLAIREVHPYLSIIMPQNKRDYRSHVSKWLTLACRCSVLVCMSIFIAGMNYQDDGTCEVNNYKDDCEAETFPYNVQFQQPSMFGDSMEFNLNFITSWINSILGTDDTTVAGHNHMCLWEPGINRCIFHGHSLTFLSALLCAVIIVALSSPIIALCDTLVEYIDAPYIPPQLIESKVDSSIDKDKYESASGIEHKSDMDYLHSFSSARTAHQHHYHQYSTGNKKGFQVQGHNSNQLWERQLAAWQTLPATLMRAARLRKMQIILDYLSPKDEIALMLAGSETNEENEDLIENEKEFDGDGDGNGNGSKKRDVPTFTSDGDGSYERLDFYFRGNVETLKRWCEWVTNIGFSLSGIYPYQYPSPSREFLLDMVEISRIETNCILDAIGPRVLRNDMTDRDEIQHTLARQFIVNSFHGMRKTLAAMHIPLIMPPHESLFTRIIAIILLMGVMLFMSIKAYVLTFEIGTFAFSFWLLSLSCVFLYDAFIFIPLQAWAGGVVVGAFIAPDCTAILESLQTRSKLLLKRVYGGMNSASGFIHHFNPACRVSRIRVLPQYAISRILFSLNDFELLNFKANRNPSTPFSGGFINSFIISLLWPIITFLGYLPRRLVKIPLYFLGSIIIGIIVYLIADYINERGFENVLIFLVVAVVIKELISIRTRYVRWKGRLSKKIMKTGKVAKGTDEIEQLKRNIRDAAEDEISPDTGGFSGFGMGMPTHTYAQTGRQEVGSRPLSASLLARERVRMQIIHDEELIQIKAAEIKTKRGGKPLIEGELSVPIVSNIREKGNKLGTISMSLSANTPSVSVHKHDLSPFEKSYLTKTYGRNTSWHGKGSGIISLPESYLASKTTYADTANIDGSRVTTIGSRSPTRSKSPTGRLSLPYFRGWNGTAKVAVELGLGDATGVSPTSTLYHKEDTRRYDDSYPKDNDVNYSSRQVGAGTVPMSMLPPLNQSKPELIVVPSKTPTKLVTLLSDPSALPFNKTPEQALRVLENAHISDGGVPMNQRSGGSRVVRAANRLKRDLLSSPTSINPQGAMGLLEVPSVAPTEINEVIEDLDGFDYYDDDDDDDDDVLFVGQVPGKGKGQLEGPIASSQLTRAYRQQLKAKGFLPSTSVLGGTGTGMGEVNTGQGERGAPRVEFQSRNGDEKYHSNNRRKDKGNDKGRDRGRDSRGESTKNDTIALLHETVDKDIPEATGTKTSSRNKSKSIKMKVGELGFEDSVDSIDSYKEENSIGSREEKEKTPALEIGTGAVVVKKGGMVQTLP
jgi:hypothetical protein